MFSLFVACSTKLKTKNQIDTLLIKILEEKKKKKKTHNENYDKFKTNQFTNFQGIKLKIQLFSTNCPSTIVHLYFS
jgi:hypothetical protein